MRDGLAMHALRRYLRAGLDARGWEQADLVRSSGLTRQRVSQMLNDDRERLPAVPKRETLVAIARAFGVGESTVTAVAFEAMGYDLEAVRREADLSTATTQDIVRALAERVGIRLEEEDGDGRVDEQSASIDHLTLAARRTGRKSRTQVERDQQDQNAGD